MPHGDGPDERHVAIDPEGLSYRPLVIEDAEEEGTQTGVVGEEQEVLDHHARVDPPVRRHSKHGEFG